MDVIINAHFYVTTDLMDDIEDFIITFLMESIARLMEEHVTSRQSRENLIRAQLWSIGECMTNRTAK